MCEALRYKDTRAQSKKIPHKVLCYFPLTPRPRRLYMLGQKAKDMSDVHEIYTIKYSHIYIFSLTFMLFCD